MSADEADALDVVEMDRGTPDPSEWSASPSPYTCPEASTVDMRARVIREALMKDGVGSAVA